VLGPIRVAVRSDDDACLAAALPQRDIGFCARDLHHPVTGALARRVHDRILPIFTVGLEPLLPDDVIAGLTHADARQDAALLPAPFPATDGAARARAVQINKAAIAHTRGAIRREFWVMSAIIHSDVLKHTMKVRVIESDVYKHTIKVTFITSDVHKHTIKLTFI
jgi:hypothetical protein